MNGSTSTLLVKIKNRKQEDGYEGERPLLLRAHSFYLFTLRVMLLCGQLRSLNLPDRRQWEILKKICEELQNYCMKLQSFVRLLRLCEWKHTIIRCYVTYIHSGAFLGCGCGPVGVCLLPQIVVCNID